MSKYIDRDFAFVMWRSYAKLSPIFFLSFDLPITPLVLIIISLMSISNKQNKADHKVLEVVVFYSQHRD